MEVMIMVVVGLFVCVPIGHSLWVLHYARTQAPIDRRLDDYVSR